MREPFRVFISAVSSEFRQAREAVASDLRARGLTVKVQLDFRQEAETDTTLSKLHKYVAECDAVVAVVGRRSGAFPSEDAAKPYAHLLPTGFPRLSYTQWEVIFARHHGRRLSFYVPDATFKPEEDPGDQEDSAAQQAFSEWLFGTLDLDRTGVNNKDDLRAAVLKEHWPDHRQAKYIDDRFRSIGTLFKGRDKEMQRLRELLPKGPTAVGARTPAIHGLGGIGKTRLALEYGVAHERDYTALIFLSAEDEAKLKSDLLKLHGALRISDGKEEDAKIAAALDWLKRNPGWFLVLDNADTPEAMAAVERYLGQLQAGGHMVVTTRIASFGARFQRLDLDVLSVEDAAAFLLERTDGTRRPAPDDAETAVLIARDDLGQLALALEVSGALIEQERYSLKTYQAEWNSNRDDVLRFNDEAVTGYPRAMAITWKTSVDKLGERAKAMLGLIAQFAPEPIPETILDTAIHRLQPTPEPEPRKPLSELARFSLVSRLKDAESFLMHRVVQDVTRRSMTDAERLAARAAAIRWLYDVVPEARPGHADMPARRDVLLKLASHVEVLAPDEAAGSEAGIAAHPGTPPAAWLMVQIGDAYAESGFSTTAYRFQRRAIDLRQKLALADPGNARFQRDLSNSWNKIGDLAVAAGDGKAAREAFEKALQVAQKLANADPGNAGYQRDLSISFERIGDLAVAAGDGKAAREAFEEKLQINQKLALADPNNAQFQRDLFVSWIKLGDLAVAAGDGKAAREAFEKGLQVAQKLANADPGNAGYQRDLIISNVKLAEIDGDPAGRYRAALAIAERLQREGRLRPVDVPMIGELQRRLKDAGG